MSVFMAITATLYLVFGICAIMYFFAWLFDNL